MKPLHSASGVMDVLVFPGDVTRPEECAMLVEKTIERFGRLDYLIANAGISMWSRFDEVEDLSVFARIMAVNYLGTVNPLYSALPHLKASQGLVVCISSIQGRIGVPLHTGYSASKHALQGFFDSLRGELKGTGVDILMVYPSWLSGTGLRDRALGREAPATARRPNTDSAVPADICSEKIVKAILHRKRRITIPAKLKLLPLAAVLLPDVVSHFVSRKVRKQQALHAGSAAGPTK
jgi:short-subunit dehydrogenase